MRDGVSQIMSAAILCPAVCISDVTNMAEMCGKSITQVFTYLVFTRMPGDSYHRQLRSLLLY